MQYFIFFYNIILIILFGVCGFSFLQKYFSSKKRLALWIAVMFFFYICDNLFFAMTEFIPAFVPIYQKLITLFPYLNNLVDIGMLISFRMILAYWFDYQPSKRERFLHYIILMVLLATTAIPPSYWARISYRIAEQVIVAAISIQGFYALYLKKEKFSPQEWRQYFWVLAISALLHVGGAIECLVAAFAGPKAYTYRIISYEFFGVFCTVIALYYIIKKARMPAIHKVTEAELLLLFVSEYRLTSREAELIPLLLDGADNASICEEKCISLNTVKVHTHNIYQKLSIERRSQLSAKFAEYRKLHTNS